MVSDPHWPRASGWLGRNDPAPELVVVGVPTSAGSISPSEAWRTPAAVREALGRMATYDGEVGVDLRDLRVADCGDWPLAHLDATAVVGAIGEAVGDLTAGPVHAFLGGDNLITWPIAANLPGTDLSRMGLLTFDAHHDVRVMPDGPNNGAPVRGLIEAGLPGDHVVQVGIHSFANSREYREWCDGQGIRVITMESVEEHGIGAAVAAALAGFPSDVDAIHVDFDIDVLDRASAPGCPGARPGGMQPRQLAAAARIVGAHPQVVSADFVEVDVTRDVADITVLNLATTLLAFASGVAMRRGRPDQEDQT